MTARPLRLGEAADAGEGAEAEAEVEAVLYPWPAQQASLLMAARSATCLRPHQR